MTQWNTKTVFVTGASRGIGRGIAEMFLSKGSNVYLGGRNREQLAEMARTLAARYPGHCSPVEVDVSSRASCDRAVDEITDSAGGLDIVCANAGIYPEAELDRMTDADMEEVFATNTFGTIRTVQACAGPVVGSGNGRFVLTSSITGPVTGYRGLSHYGASKAAQLGFMRSAALELAATGTTVNAVLPGSVGTESLAVLADGSGDDMVAAIPCGRLGTPSDIAAATLFFASDEASYVTGQTLVVDGGQTLPEHSGAF